MEGHMLSFTHSRTNTPTVASSSQVFWHQWQSLHGHWCQQRCQTKANAFHKYCHHHCHCYCLGSCTCTCPSSCCCCESYHHPCSRNGECQKEVPSHLCGWWWTGSWFVASVQFHEHDEHSSSLCLCQGRSSTPLYGWYTTWTNVDIAEGWNQKKSLGEWSDGEVLPHPPTLTAIHKEVKEKQGQVKDKWTNR